MRKSGSGSPGGRQWRGAQPGGLLVGFAAEFFDFTAAAFAFEKFAFEGTGTRAFLAAGFLGVGAALGADGPLVFLETREEAFAGEFAIGGLRTGILNGDGEAAGRVGEGDGGGNFVDVLAAGTAGAREGFDEIAFVDPELAAAFGERLFHCARAASAVDWVAPLAMEVIIESDPDAVSQQAARWFRQQLRQEPGSVLGLATGTTPLGLYRELIRLQREGEIYFGAVTTFNLDEYVGLGPEHPQSYRYYMEEHLFAQVNLVPERIHALNGLAADLAGEAEEYEAKIRAAGGIDLQLLGLGGDGHIGFNEPSSSLASRTRLKSLTARTIADNARFFSTPDEVPRHVLTMGVGTIMEARRVVVLATGAGKAAAVRGMVEGPITASVPASILQMHPRCVLVVDEAAAKDLERAEYYRWVFANKPGWQRV